MGFIMSKGGSEKTSGAGQKAPTGDKDKIPHGREAVRKAILNATEKLLLKKSPNQITVREIAAAARIKHPLVHRHFGTKEDVIIAVHARGIAKVEQRVAKVENLEGNVGTFFEAVKRNRFRQVALSRAMLDGVPPHAIQNEFPVMQHLLKLIKKRCEENAPENPFTPEMLTAVLAAAALGWMFYEPFLLAATEQTDQKPAELHKSVVEILEEIVRKIC